MQSLGATTICRLSNQCKLCPSHSTGPFNMIPFISSVTFWEVDQYVTKEWCSNLQPSWTVQAQPKIRCPAHQTSATSLAFSRYSWHPQISTTWRADSHSGWLWSPTNNKIKHRHTTMTKNHQGFRVWGKNKFEIQSAAICSYNSLSAHWSMHYGPCAQLFLGDSSPFDWLMCQQWWERVHRDDLDQGPSLVLEPDPPSFLHRFCRWVAFSPCVFRCLAIPPWFPGFPSLQTKVVHPLREFSVIWHS